MQRELLDGRTWATRAELGSVIFEWSEGFDNSTRRHCAFGLRPPADYETINPTAALTTAA